MITYFPRHTETSKIIHVNNYKSSKNTSKFGEKSDFHCKKSYSMECKHKNYFQEMKPIFFIMRIVGLLPVEISSRG